MTDRQALLDFNHGLPVWHTSVAALDVRRQRTYRSSQLSSGQRKCLIEYAKLLLSGVGTMPSKVEQHELAFHYRKAVSPEEIAQLPEWWCAIEAVDMAGSGKILEVNV